MRAGQFHCKIAEELLEGHQGQDEGSGGHVLAIHERTNDLCLKVNCLRSIVCF